jgi:hypothetical protein
MDSSLRLVAPLLVALACIACPGRLEDPSRFDDGGGTDDTDATAPPDEGGSGSDAGCSDVPATIFTPKCATAGCHSSGDKAQGLDLQSADVGTRLAGACATEGSGYLINLTTPNASVLYTKLSASPPYPSRMPVGGPYLDDTQMACVLAFLSAQKGTAQNCGGDAGKD